jgi:hypothetical protein
LRPASAEEPTRSALSTGDTPVEYSASGTEGVSRASAAHVIGV